MLHCRLVQALAVNLLIALTVSLEGSDEVQTAVGPKTYVYYGNWTPYRGFHPQNLPAQATSHVLYAFLNVGADGTVFSGDEYADLERRYEGDSWVEPGQNAYGCVKQLFKMKKENRNLKVMLSIGGWTWSANFSAVAGTLEGRNTFARSAVGLMGDWGFDGIDVDWEFPSDQTEGLSFLELLRSVRRELDDYAARQAVDYRFQLSFAAPAGERHYQHLPLREMAAVVDNVNLMAYDFAGPWADHTAHTANMYLDELHPESTPYSVSGAVEAYINMGVPAEKLVVGLPLFGRAFEGTQGLGQPFSGVGTGSWEKGAWDYKALPKAGAAILHDDQAQADYTYDGFELISFDTPRTAKEKARFVLQRQLGGLMFWEASADRSDSEALITTAMRELGSIDRTENLLSYPGSKYANLV